MNLHPTNKHTPIEVGKYRVAPLVRELDDGRFAASVSIRSGRGSGMHDRVLRFVPLFENSAAAVRYATLEGLAWVGERLGSAGRPAVLRCA